MIRNLIVGVLTTVIAFWGAAGAVADPIVGASKPTLMSSLTESGSQLGALQTLGSCIAGRRPADFLLLIDESSSLRFTDPTAARVTSAEYLVDQLATFGARTKTSISVAVAAFGDRYQSIADWRGLGATSNTELHSAIESLRTRTSGFDTDYWTALHDAQSALIARASGRPDSRCQAIVWFTDGALSYSPRLTAGEQRAYGTRKVFDPTVELTTQASADRITAAAEQDLCRPGGVADQVRTSGITMLTIGLSTPTSHPDFGLLKRISTGTSGGQLCGDQAASAPGAFFPAGDLESLLLAFDAISTPGTPPLQGDAGICQGATTVCADGAHDFVLDSSISSVEILATTSVSGLSAVLQGPDGHQYRIARGASGQSGSSGAGGVRVNFRWVTDKALSIGLEEGSAGTSAWTGRWGFAFIDPASSSAHGRSHTNIHLQSSIRPSSSLPASLRSGSSVTAHFGLKRTDGTIVDPGSLLGSLDYSAVLVDSHGGQHQILNTSDKSVVVNPVKLSLVGVPVGPGALQLTDQITTASTTDAKGAAVQGTRLSATTVSVPLTIAPPASYPRVQSAVDFGTVTGHASATAELKVSGSGCVWLAGKTDVVAVPSGISSPTVSADASSRSSCAVVRSGDRLRLTLAVNGSGTGQLNGTVQVESLPMNKSGAVVTSPVTIAASFQRPLNETNFLIALVVAIILGPGIPLVLLYGLKWWVSRIPARALTASLIDITVDDRGVRRDGEPFAVRLEDFRGHIGMGRLGPRSVSVGDVLLRARTGPSPVGPGRVIIDAGDRLAVSDMDGGVVHTRASLPLAVHGHFVVLRTPGSPVDQAQLLLLMGGDAGAPEQRRIADEVNRRVPELVSALVDIDPSPPPSASALPSGIGSGAGSSASPNDNPWGF